MDGGTLDIHHFGLDGEERGGVSKVPTTCVAGACLLVRQFKVSCGTCLVFSSVDNQWGGHVTLGRDYMLPWEGTTCYLGKGLHVTLGRDYMLPWERTTCYLGKGLHVTLGRDYMLPWEGTTCYLGKGLHVTLGRDYMLP